MPPEVNFNFYKLDSDILSFLKKEGPLPFVASGDGPDNIGEIGWDDAAGTLSLKVAESVNVELGEKLIFPVENNTGSLITKGTPVSYAGTIGNSGKVRVKPWDGGSDSGLLFIGLAAADIPSGQFGYAVHFGELRGVNTSAFTAGSILYANPAGHGLVQNVTDQPHVVVALCVSSGNNGVLRIRPTVVSAAKWDNIEDKPLVSEFEDPNSLALRTQDGDLRAAAFMAEGSAGATFVVPGTVDVFEYTPTIRQGSLRPQPPGGSQFISAQLPRSSGVLLVGEQAAHNFLMNPTSSNLALLLTDENGISGGFVRSNGAALGAVTIGGALISGAINFNTATFSFDAGSSLSLNTALGIPNALALKSDVTHTHGQLTSDGRIGSTADRVVTTTTAGALTTQSRSGIDSRTSFPNSDVSAATSDGTPNVIVRRDSAGQIFATGFVTGEGWGSGYYATDLLAHTNASGGDVEVRISPTLTSPIILNWPSQAGTLAVATNTAQSFLAAPSSNTLSVALGDASGTSGGFVRATGATLTTPLINNPTVQGYTEGSQNIAASGTAQTLNISSNTLISATLTANCTFTLPAAATGLSFTLIVFSGTGAFTTTFVAPAGSSISWANQIVPVGTNIANRADLYSFVAHGTRWFASQSPNHSA